MHIENRYCGCLNQTTTHDAKNDTFTCMVCGSVKSRRPRKSSLSDYRSVSSTRLLEFEEVAHLKVS